jgi:hypothetical protein
MSSFRRLSYKKYLRNPTDGIPRETKRRRFLQDLTCNYEETPNSFVLETEDSAIIDTPCNELEDFDQVHLNYE